jgi:GNAT superfamily N-acetyltransferase
VGSIIEVFPRGARRAGLWRAVPLPGSGHVRVRQARLEDYAAIRALQRESASTLAGSTLKQLESQRQVFAEGQLVATGAEGIVGAASSLIVPWDDHAEGQSWRTVTGDGSFATHDPHASTLLCAELVAADGRGLGVARSLYRTLRRLARKLNLRRIVAAARMPGYQRAREQMSPELYAQRVIWGTSRDAGLEVPLSDGFQYCGVIRNYMPEDVESAGHAALLVWLNPAYSPTEPPANLEAVRPRKCA